jgi:TRAP-type C4-dicarboxylate transport system substrate-binding protein
MRRISKTSRLFWFVLMFTFIFTSAAYAQEFKLRISAGVGDKHCWVAGQMQPFADKIEKRTNGRIKFTRFMAGELCKAGQELECLRGGSIDVAAPFLAPYHAGVFPLGDVTMLPVMNTTAVTAEKAWSKLLASKVPLKDGKTFYQLEIVSRDLVAWPIAPTQPYYISTLGKRFNKVSDIKGTPLRGGSRTHLIYLKAFGANPVYMVGMDAYDAFSRGSIVGIIYSIPDWKSYGFQELIRYTITGIGLGHFNSYIAVMKKTWDKFPPDIQKIWTETAMEQSVESGKYWISLTDPVIKEAKEKYKAVFEDVSKLDPGVQKVMYAAAVETWKTWIDEEEKKGHPAKATAKLWAQLITAEGGVLPAGIKEYLASLK